MAITVTIDGTPVGYRLGSCSITKPLSAQWTCVIDIPSDDGTYVPATKKEIVIEHDVYGVLFGGFTEVVEIRGAGDEPITPIVNRVESVGYTSYALRRFLTQVVEVKTMKAFLEDVIMPKLTAYGVTLDPAQSVGSNVPAREFTNVRIDEALNYACEFIDGGARWAWEIDDDKVLRTFEVGTLSTAFDVSPSDDNAYGDIRVTREKRTSGNRVIGVFGPAQTLEVTELHTGDGSTSIYETDFPMEVREGGHVGRGVQKVTFPDSVHYETFGTSPATWLYDAVSDPNTIYRVIGGTVTPQPVTAGYPIELKYDSVFPQTITAEDAADILANGVTEIRITDETIITKAAMINAVATVLAQQVSEIRNASYSTGRLDVLPGREQTITSAKRHTSESFVIGEVVFRDDADGDFRAFVTATGTFTGTFRKTYDAWLGGSTGGKTTFPISTTPGSNSAQGPDKAIQVNVAGQFFGEQELRYHYASNSISMGDGSDIESTDAESCGAFGRDCIIGDPI